MPAGTKKRRSWLRVATAALALALGAMSGAGATDPRPPFAEWLQGLRADARLAGIRDATFDRALAGVEPIPRVIELDRRQPEFTLTFREYMDRVVPPARVEKGRQQLNENRRLLDEISAKYGVQGRFLVAFWGVETDFGRQTGGFPVVAALATLAYDGRRSAYFRKELIFALEIVERGHVTPERMIGSWAGAMGQAQFMPSSFRSYAIDHDGDGRIDLWNSRPDVLASAANYLKRSGWKGDETWGRPVNLPEGFDPRLTGTGVVKTLAEWSALGIARADGTPLSARPLKASVVRAEGDKGPAFLVYDNYRTILKWNRSTFFAIAVGSLADLIGDG
ncbi:MAG: lytic murein transglycosylase [Rhodospirillales bacterium]|nr:lytic murein transglycosylase [Rhodospirillales bacterium]